MTVDDVADAQKVAPVVEDDVEVAEPQGLVRGVVLGLTRGEIPPATSLVAEEHGLFLTCFVVVSRGRQRRQCGKSVRKRGLFAPDGLLADGICLWISGVEAKHGGRCRAAVFAWIGERWIGGDQQLAAEQDYGRRLAGAASGVAVD